MVNNKTVIYKKSPCTIQYRDFPSMSIKCKTYKATRLKLVTSTFLDFTKSDTFLLSS